MQDAGTTIGQRIKRVMDEKCGGNQRELGRLLATPQAVVSRTVNDQRSPSFEFLLALVLKTGVDAKWLLTGNGKPFGETSDVLLEAHSLPLSKRLLEQTSQVLGELPRFSFPQLEGLYRESRYLVEVQRHDPAVRVKAAKIKAGDLLVLETDPAFWTNHLAQLSRRDCVVSIASGNTTTLALGNVATKIMPDDVPDEIAVNVYGGETVSLQLSEFDAQFKTYGKNIAPIQLDRGAAPAVVKLSAVVLLLWRPS